MNGFALMRVGKYYRELLRLRAVGRFRVKMCTARIYILYKNYN